MSGKAIYLLFERRPFRFDVGALHDSRFLFIILSTSIVIFSFSQSNCLLHLFS